MGSRALIMASRADQSDELGVLDGDNDSVSAQNRSLLTAVLKGLTVQLEYLIILCRVAHYFQINYIS